MPARRNRDAPSGSSVLAHIVEGSAGKSTIRLRQLRHFLAAADHGSFRKAAIALVINESSVSRQIRDLDHGATAVELRDGIHPGNAGQRRIARALEPTLVEVLSGTR